MGSGIDHLLPYLPKGTITTSTADFDEKTRARIKARQSMVNSNTNINSKPIDRSKSKQTIPKESTLALNEKKKELAEKTDKDEKKEPVIGEAEAKKEGEESEEPIQEVKKPRYFPPKKLPNPFENAA